MQSFRTGIIKKKFAFNFYSFIPFIVSKTILKRSTKSSSLSLTLCISSIPISLKKELKQKFISFFSYGKVKKISLYRPFLGGDFVIIACIFKQWKKNTSTSSVWQKAIATLLYTLSFLCFKVNYITIVLVNLQFILYGKEIPCPLALLLNVKNSSPCSSLKHLLLT